MTAAKTKFEALDTLRGLAAIAVAVFHFIPGWGGYLAVDFFLILSGFVLSHSYLYSKRTTTTSKFVGHRIARLYPMHVFTLVTFILTVFFIKGGLPNYTDGNYFTLLQHLTLTHNVGLNPNGITYNYPSWSISVEFWVNIVFIVFITKTTKNSFLLIASMIGFTLIYLKSGHLDTHASNYFQFINSGLLRGLSSFFLGILAYRVFLCIRERNKSIILWNCIEIFCVFFVFFVLFWRAEKYSALDFLSPLIFFACVVVFALEFGFLSLYIKKFKYLGDISYSIYLNQITVLLLVQYLFQDTDVPRLLVLYLYLLALVGCSALTYKYIEIPMKNRLRGLFDRQV